MTTAPYGSWSSPIGIEDLTSTSVGLGGVRVDGGDLYWLESHADQGGRVSLWRRPLTGGEPVEVTPAEVNVRTRVNEYGGGEYGVDAGTVVWSDLADGRLHRQERGGTPVPLTAPGPVWYGDVTVDAARGLVLAVREDHRPSVLEEHGEAETTLVAVPLDGSAAEDDAAVRVLARGADFYSTPVLSAQGRLAWVQWDHPNMPWDSTAVRVGRLTPDGVDAAETVAGGPGESVGQPRWRGEDLVFASDRTGWWNLYLLESGAVRALHEAEAEFVGPQWVLGQTPYALLDDDRLLCSLTREGDAELAVLEIETGTLTSVVPTSVGATVLDAGPAGAAAVLAFPDRPAVLAVLDLSGGWSRVRASSPGEPDPSAVSVARAVSWPGTDGPVHGWYYPPVNPGFVAPEGTLPPLVTLSHGGPTSQATAAYAVGYQYWTSRGYAILDVNYGGSTGYGRVYRDRLQGRWGIVDVEDCANGAAAMGTQGLADPARLVVKGGSAGGYTTLCALTATTTFAAGISSYGVGDLEILARDTHKFESRYLDGLVGPYPEARDVYLDRSPIYHVDQLAAPILLLQGRDDLVVPPNQAELMARAAEDKGLPVALLMFDGEGHGFRRAETIRASVEAQVYFLGRVLGFTPADDVPAVPIANLPSAR